MNNQTNELVLTPEEMKNLQDELGAVQKKFKIQLIAILDTTPEGIIPRIAIVSVPELSAEAIEPAAVLEGEDQVDAPTLEVSETSEVSPAEEVADAPVE